MYDATATPADKSLAVHLWEGQKLGKAPFKCVGCVDLGSMRGNCHACGQAIRYEFEIAGSDGSKFVVGSDCVAKTSDAGLTRYVDAEKKRMVKLAAKKAKRAKAIKAFEDSLSTSPRGNMTVRRLGENVEFFSPFTDREALAELKSVDGKFAKDLTASLEKWGSLFPNQLTWVHKLVVDAKTPKAPKPAAVALDDFGAIAELFKTAKANGTKYPKITFKIDGQTVKLALAGDRAKLPGSVNVTDGRPFGENTWFGRIVDGKFQPSKSATEEIVNFLKTFAADPAKVAKEYGHKNGCCCFCSKELTDARSVHEGYGPVCAKKFGLPMITLKELKKLTGEKKELDPAKLETEAKKTESEEFDTELVAPF